MSQRHENYSCMMAGVWRREVEIKRWWGASSKGPAGYVQSLFVYLEFSVETSRGMGGGR